METTETYTCKSCGDKSRWPISAEEMAYCHRMRWERIKNRLRWTMIIGACITLPILIRALLARL